MNDLSSFYTLNKLLVSTISLPPLPCLTTFSGLFLNLGAVFLSAVTGSAFARLTLYYGAPIYNNLAMN